MSSTPVSVAGAEESALPAENRPAPAGNAPAPGKDAPGAADASSSSPEPKPGRECVDPELGILIVHGIGDQKRGGDLLWAGEGLAQWLQRWLDRGYADKPPSKSGLNLSGTYVAMQDPGDPHAPPHATLWLRDAPEKRPQDERVWLLAEAWWAQTFPAPRFGDLVAWGLSIGPFMIHRLLSLPIERLFNKALKPAHLPAMLAGGVLLVVIWAIVLLVAHIFFPLFVIGLLILQVVPPLSGFVAGAQLALAGWLGDAYVIATSPLQTAAMVRQIQHDVEWLWRRGCRRVAIIAHSGGAPVAYDALTFPHYRLKPGAVLLLTYGSGKRKVDIMRQLLADRSFPFAVSPLARVIMLAALFAGLPLALGAELTFAGQALLVLAAAIFAALLWQHRRFGRRLDAACDSGPRFDDSLPESVTWHDYSAIADLVAEGSPTQKRHPDQQERTYMVHNLHSLLSDHGSYWQNAEEFVPAVVQHLQELGAGPQWSKRERLVLQESARRRETRVRVYMYTGLLSLLMVVPLCATLWPYLEDIGRPLAELAARIIPGGEDGAPGQERNAVDPGWARAVGMLLVAAWAALWHQLLLFPSWRWWSRRETSAMYRRVLLRDQPPADTGEADEWRSAVRRTRAGTRAHALSVMVLPLLLLAVTLWLRADPPAGLFEPSRGLWLDTALAVDMVALGLAGSVALSALLAGSLSKEDTPAEPSATPRRIDRDPAAGPTPQSPVQAAVCTPNTRPHPDH